MQSKNETTPTCMLLQKSGTFYPQRGEGGGRRPPTERRRGPEGPESTEQSLK